MVVGVVVVVVADADAVAVEAATAVVVVGVVVVVVADADAVAGATFEAVSAEVVAKHATCTHDIPFLIRCPHILAQNPCFERINLPTAGT